MFFVTSLLLCACYFFIIISYLIFFFFIKFFSFVCARFYSSQPGPSARWFPRLPQRRRGSTRVDARHTPRRDQVGRTMGRSAWSHWTMERWLGHHHKRKRIFQLFFFMVLFFFHNSTLSPSRLIGGCGLTKVLRNSTRKSFRERNGIVTETCSTRSSSLRPYIKRAVPVILESQFSLPFSPFFQRLFWEKKMTCKWRTVTHG